MDGVWNRFKLACRAFFVILFQSRLPADVIELAVEAAAPTAAVPEPTVHLEDDGDRAVQMLALLQRDGRLVDFLMEDLGTYTDAQIGTAVRDVHAGCRGVIERYLTLESILGGREREPVRVAEGFDPAAVRLVGRVTGRPPFQGTLLHRGWLANRVDLPPLGSGAARRVVAPAEVEVA